MKKTRADTASSVTWANAICKYRKSDAPSATKAATLPRHVATSKAKPVAQQLEGESILKAKNVVTKSVVSTVPQARPKDPNDNHPSDAENPRLTASIGYQVESKTIRY